MTTRWTVSLAFSLVAVVAQTPTERAYQGQSWVGLLVPATCDKKSDAKGKSNREADLTTDRRTTTPAVDDAGTRGAAQAGPATTEKQSVPETGDVLATGRSSTDAGWNAARRQAHSLGASCALNGNATQFALVLPDGRMLQFDELANQAIVKQMSGRTAKFIRVSVQGKLQGGKIAMDSIQM